MTHSPPTSPGLIVMYHYVRPDDAVNPGGIRPLLVSEFERQLAWLCDRYDVLPAGEFLSRVTASSNRDAKPPCLLTFDDGTKDHAEIVTPILARRGLSGVFFILSGPPELGQMPLTHAVHWLLGNDDERVWESFERHACDHLGGPAALGDPAEARRIYHYETPTRARIKYAANMAMPIGAVEGVVESAVSAAGRTTRDLAAEWFVSADDVRAMHAAGMAIGSHGVSHRSLQSLGGQGMRREILHASGYLARLTGERPTWFACPFGGTGAAAEDLATMRAAMLESGVAASVSTEKRHLSGVIDPLALPRLDAIDLPPRKAIPAAANGVTVRLSTPADRDAILGFIERMGFNPRDAATWDGLGMFAMTAWLDGDLIGAIPLEPRALRVSPTRVVSSLHETVVAIHPDHRGAGIGSRMQRALVDARPNDAACLTVFREQPESPAYRWYLKNGFSKVMAIESWKHDDPRAMGSGIIPETWDVRDASAPWPRVESLWIRDSLASAGGTVDRASRSVRAWLAVHPYRGHYAFRIVTDDLGGIGLVGVGRMHSRTPRADVLAMMTDSTRTSNVESLVRAIACWAAAETLRPVRIALCSNDPRAAVLHRLGFTSEWPFDLMARPLTADATIGPDASWRYASMDYI